MPKRDKANDVTISKDNLVGNADKICAALNSARSAPGHHRQLQLATTSEADIDDLTERMRGFLVGAQPVAAAMFVGTTPPCDETVEMVFRALWLWLTAALATKPLKTLLTKDLHDHQAAELLQKIQRHFRPSSTSTYKTSKQEFNRMSDNDTRPAPKGWLAVTDFVTRIRDIEDRCAKAGRALNDADLFDTLVDTVERSDKDFSYVIGKIRDEKPADDAFPAACLAILNRCEELRSDPSPKAASYFADRARAKCTHCGAPNHVDAKCFKKHPELRATVDCRKFTSSPRQPCAQTPCPFRHPSTPSSHFAAEQLPSPPGPDAFNGQYSFLTTEAVHRRPVTAAVRDTAPPPSYSSQKTDTSQSGSTDQDSISPDFLPAPKNRLQAWARLGAFVAFMIFYAIVASRMLEII